MKGLIIKDFFALKRQLRILLVWAVLFSLIPGYSTAGFVIIYAAVLPVSALAYDEKSKWNKYAAMLPYKSRDIVLGKYIFGYMLMIAAAVLSVLLQLAVSAVKKAPVDAEFFVTVLTLTAVASLMQGINLPFMLFFGVEKGRLLFILLSMVVVIVGISAGNIFTVVLNEAQINILPTVIIAAAVIAVLNVASIFISVKIYNRVR